MKKNIYLLLTCVLIAFATAISKNATAQFNVTYSVTNAMCGEGNDGAITVNVSGGTPVYFLHITNSEESYTASEALLEPGSYTFTNLYSDGYLLTVSDLEDDFYAHEVPVILSDSILNVTAAPDTIVAGNSATLTTSGAMSYIWSNGATGSSITVSPDTTTIYYVRGALANGCTGYGAVTVTVHPYPQLGDSYGGGTVAYILQPGDPGYDQCKEQGLIAGAVFGDPWEQEYDLRQVGTTSASFGSGRLNTINIVHLLENDAPAAYDCYSQKQGGYSDWYLPSVDELLKIYQNLASSGLPYSAGVFWSSTEYPADPATRAYVVDFGSGVTSAISKTNGTTVLATRSFSIDYPINAAFSATTVCAGDTTVFTDSSTVSQGSITAWHWDFGDGDTSNLQNPKYLYTSDNLFYNVTLTVTTSSGCSKAVTQQVARNPIPSPAAILIYNSTCRTGCTLEGGIIIIESYCDGGSLTWFTDNTGTTTTSMPVYNQTTPMTVYYACVDNTTQCRSTIESQTTVPGVCTMSAAPVISSGPAGACASSSNVVYSVDSVSGMSYIWTVPVNAAIASGQGNASINVSFNGSYAGGSICVYATNGSCVSDTTCINVPLLTKTPGPVTISGPPSACAGTQRTYCASANRATAYAWTATGGLSIASGRGTSCIVVNVPANYAGNGAVRCTPVNCKGSGDQVIYSVQVDNPIQGPPRFCNSGNNNVNQTTGICAGSTHKYEVCNGRSNCYIWSAPAGCVIKDDDGNTGNPLTVCSPTPDEVKITFPKTFAPGSSGFITVRGRNNCNTTDPDTLTVRNSGACQSRMEDGETTTAAEETALSAYPNPASGTLTVSFTTSQAQDYTLTLMDLPGKTVLSRRAAASQGSNLQELDLSNVAKGLYMLTLQQQSGEKQVLKIVVE